MKNHNKINITSIIFNMYINIRNKKSNCLSNEELVIL